MTSVLVIGGYGVFGGRLVELLLRDGHAVTVAGRSAEKARRFAARHGGTPLALDRNGDLGVIADHDVVVDATGPFDARASGAYRVVEAAIAGRTHYLDLSDDADFTAGIAGFDDAARAAGVSVLSGVSTVPALSGAAVAHLSEGLARIDLIESAILPGNRAPRGRAVMASILSQAGAPLSVTRGGRVRTPPGWSHSAPFDLSPDIRRRAWLIGAPDLTLFPAKFGAHTVLFRAGLELWPLSFGLAVIGWLRRRGWLRDPVKLLPLLQPMAMLFAPFGQDRGGMVVRVVGQRGGKAVERRWHLVANGGHGPFVPAIPARTLLRNPGGLVPGARPCVGDLRLTDAVAAMADRDIFCATKPERSAYLFDTVRDLDLTQLPAPVRDLHAIADEASFAGRAEVARGRGLPGRLAAWLFRFPPAAKDVAVEVHMSRDGDAERWERRFGAHRFLSHLRVVDGVMTERFGPFTFTIGLHVMQDALHYPVTAGRIGPLRLPRALLPISVAREYLEDSRARFDIDLSLPFRLGRVVRYRGWLEPVTR